MVYIIMTAYFVGPRTNFSKYRLTEISRECSLIHLILSRCFPQIRSICPFLYNKDLYSHTKLSVPLSTPATLIFASCLMLR